MDGRGRRTTDAKLRMDEVQHGLGDVLVSAGTHAVVVTHVEIDAAGGIEPVALAVEHAVSSGDDPLGMNQGATAQCDRARERTRAALDSDLDEDEHNTRITDRSRQQATYQPRIFRRPQRVFYTGAHFQLQGFVRNGIIGRTDGAALTEIVRDCGLAAFDVATIDHGDALGSAAWLDEHPTAVVNGAKVEAMPTRWRRRTLDR